MQQHLILPDTAGAGPHQLARWLKAEGEAVTAGDAVAEVETDKAAIEIEAETDGFLVRRLVEAGDDIALGQALAIIGTEEDGGPALDRKSVV